MNFIKWQLCSKMEKMRLTIYLNEKSETNLKKKISISSTVFRSKPTIPKSDPLQVDLSNMSCLFHWIVLFVYGSLKKVNGKDYFFRDLLTIKLGCNNRQKLLLTTFEFCLKNSFCEIRFRNNWFSRCKGMIICFRHYSLLKNWNELATLIGFVIWRNVKN